MFKSIVKFYDIKDIVELFYETDNIEFFMYVYMCLVCIFTCVYVCSCSLCVPVCGKQGLMSLSSSIALSFIL